MMFLKPHLNFRRMALWLAIGELDSEYIILRVHGCYNQPMMGCGGM